MRLIPLQIAAVCLLAFAAACSTPEDDGTKEETPEAEATTEAAPTVHASAVFPEFEVPEGFAQVEGGETPFKLEYEYDSRAFALDSSPSDVIYVTSYLLPEDGAPGNYQQMAPFVDQYNTASANEIEDSVTSPAVLHGYQGIFRFAEVRDSLNAKVYQRNFFAFDGNLMIHLSCQWQAFADDVKSACQQVAQQLTIPSP